MEIFCQNCGAAVSETAKFCKRCGTKIERVKEKSFCEECGTELSADADFCEECGARVSTAAAGAVADTALSADAWDTAATDGWGDTLDSLTAFDEESRLAAFEYERRPDGSVVITGLRDKYAVNIEIPEGVTVIAEEAFSGTKIISVTLPEGLTTIDRRAFFNCDNLQRVTLPASLVMICAEAFAECERLELEIPDTVSVVEESVLRGTALDLRKKEAEKRAKAAELERIQAEEEEKKRKEAEALAEKKAKEDEKRKKDAERRRQIAEYKKQHQEAWARGLEENAFCAPSQLSQIYNDPIAVEWLKERSSSNYYAALVLAKCYIHGYGTSVNREKANEILVRLRCASNALPRVKDEARWIAEALRL